MSKTTDIQQLAETWISSKSDKDFKKLYSRLRPGVWSYLGGIEPDFERRNDLVNVVFAKAVKAIEQYDAEKGKFSTWFYRIAYTEALIEKNRNARFTSLDALEEEGFPVRDEEDTSYESTDTIMMGGREEIIQNLYEKVCKAFSECKDKQIADAFIKWHVEKKPYEQIGQELGICTNTAKQKIFKGKKIVREALMKTDKNLIEGYKDVM